MSTISPPTERPAPSAEPALARPRGRGPGSLGDDFRRVMADENGQAAVEMAIMLAMLTGAIVFTNEMFNALVQDHIDTLLHVLQPP